MDDLKNSMNADRDEFSKKVRDRNVLCRIIKEYVREAREMDLESIEKCLELEDDGTVRSIDMDVQDSDFAPMLRNVFRLRLPGRKDVIVVLNRG